MRTKTIINILVFCIIILAVIASAYGFFSNNTIHENKVIQTVHEETVTLHGKGLYSNESVSMAAQARAQDSITLFVGIPLLIVSLWLSNKNSIKGKLLLTGTLGYFLYTYVSYSFLVSYNMFFLMYVTLMSLSFFAFIINFTAPELKDLNSRFTRKFPKKYIGLFTIVVGLFVCLLWLGMLVPSIKKAPALLEQYTTFVIQALDLGFVVPAAILSGILLIKNKSLGYLLASTIIIKGATLLLALVMMIIFMIMSGIDVPLIQIIVFPLCALLCIINLFILLVCVT